MILGCCLGNSPEVWLPLSQKGGRAFQTDGAWSGYWSPQFKLYSLLRKKKWYTTLYSIVCTLYSTHINILSSAHDLLASCCIHVGKLCMMCHGSSLRWFHWLRSPCRHFRISQLGVCNQPQVLGHLQIIGPYRFHDLSGIKLSQCP